MTLLRTSEAFAGEQSSLTISALKPDFNGSRPPTPASVDLLPTAAMMRIPVRYQPVELSSEANFSPREFRPRGRSIMSTDSLLGDTSDAPMMRGTTVWQRLSDYRTHGRVRVVTLWETSGNSVSLQAGRKGDPSLQWTSRLMNRGGATRGVLDEFLSSSLGGFSRGLHLGSHGGSADSSKPQKPTDANSAAPLVK